jgi:hypothetical protein
MNKMKKEFKRHKIIPKCNLCGEDWTDNHNCKKEFNLRKKRKKLKEQSKGLSVETILKIVEEQDKEFISRLKESDCMGERQRVRINNLAGDDLINSLAENGDHGIHSEDKEPETGPNRPTSGSDNKQINYSKTTDGSEDVCENCGKNINKTSIFCSANCENEYNKKFKKKEKK